LGVKYVWLPPPSRSLAPQGYIPQQLYDLNGSKYGNEEELKSLISKLKAANITAIADIVINHRNADRPINGIYKAFRCGSDALNR
jgi:alpha-amylase